MKFHENRSKGSGDMEHTRKCYGRTDGMTDAGHSYNPLPLRGGGLILQAFPNKVHSRKITQNASKGEQPFLHINKISQRVLKGIERTRFCLQADGRQADRYNVSLGR